MHNVRVRKMPGAWRYEIIAQQVGDGNSFITSIRGIADRQTRWLGRRTVVGSASEHQGGAMREEQIAYLSSADHILERLLACGLKQRFAPAVLAAAAELLEPPASREWVIAEARQFFASRAGLIPHGLEELPSRWVQQLPLHLEGREMGPFMITSLALEQGVLCVAFAHEVGSKTGRMTMWDDLRFMLNLALQPNIWHPLTRKEEFDIWNRWPELRRRLFILSD